MRRAFLIPAVTLLALAAFDAPARAEFNVCNKTSVPTRVAIGRFDGKNWTSEGWWTIKGQTCSSLIPGRLDSRYYYLYATDGTGAWDGKTHFCVAPDTKFKAPGRANCAHAAWIGGAFSRSIPASRIAGRRPFPTDPRSRDQYKTATHFS